MGEFVDLSLLDQSSDFCFFGELIIFDSVLVESFPFDCNGDFAESERCNMN